MRRMKLVVVIPVGKVVGVDLDIHTLRDAIPDHGVEHPVTWYLLDEVRGWVRGRGGTGGAAVNKIAAAAYLKFPGQVLREPEVESVLGDVGQLSANGSGKKLRLHNFTVQVSVAGE